MHDRRPIAAARLLGSLERLVYRLARRAVRGTDLAPIHRLTIDVQRRALACALRSPANAKHPPFDPPDGGDHRGELHVEGHGDGGAGGGHPRAGPVTVDALRGDRQSLPVREQLAPALVTSSRRRWPATERAARSGPTMSVNATAIRTPSGSTPRPVPVRDDSFADAKACPQTPNVTAPDGSQSRRSPPPDPWTHCGRSRPATTTFRCRTVPSGAPSGS